MYEVLSKYYNQLFKFNPMFKEFLKPFTIPGHRAIDLGCGTGRLTHLISELKMSVHGVDLDEHMILVAKKEYPGLDFNIENMLDSLNEDQFDLITCFGNTIVHLNIEELKILLSNVSKSLTEHGHFIIQMLNYDALLKNRPEKLKDLTTDSVKLVRRYVYESNRIRFETELHTEETVFNGYTYLYPYTIEEMIQVIKKYEFNVDIYGDLIKDEINDQTQHVYIVIKRKKY